MSAVGRSPSHPRIGIPLGLLVLLLAAASILLAAGVGYLLAAAAGLREPWIVAVASAAGMALTALPIGALVYGLARTAERSAPAVVEPAAVPGPALTRERFMELAEREWSRARRYGSGAALLVVEVDRFARHVDRHGRDAGSAIMSALAHDIAPTLRAADALADYGEGQLAVFLAHADALGALDVAERVRERTELLEVEARGERLRASVSVGVAHLRAAHLHLQALVEDAADALLAARQAGGNCVRAAPVEVSRFSAPGSRRNDQRAPKP